METPKRKAPVLEHRGIKSKYCKTNSSTPISIDSYFWIRQAIYECYRLYDTKGANSKSRFQIQLIISFLESALVQALHCGADK